MARNPPTPLALCGVEAPLPTGGAENWRKGIAGVCVVGVGALTATPMLGDRRSIGEERPTDEVRVTRRTVGAPPKGSPETAGKGIEETPHAETALAACGGGMGALFAPLESCRTTGALEHCGTKRTVLLAGPVAQRGVCAEGEATRTKQGPFGAAAAADASRT
mmetsp:Transcript_27938/g.80128  ORF Transcript_27938/g.80128 Transcript_27938/m.80128 type:complete len:163 (+) Transcript_27938:230-718(+)